MQIASFYSPLPLDLGSTIQSNADLHPASIFTLEAAICRQCDPHDNGSCRRTRLSHAPGQGFLIPDLTVLPLKDLQNRVHIQYCIPTSQAGYRQASWSKSE